MEDEIDYGALFGVSAESGETVPAGGGPERTEDVPDLDTSDRGTEAGQGQEPDRGGVSDLGTSGQEPGAQDAPGGLAAAQGTSSARGTSSALQADDRPGSLATAQRADDRPGGLTAAQAKQAAQRAIDEVFARSGMRDPYTGKPITSKAEYDAYRERYDADRREKILKKTGMSGEEFQRFVQDLPEVRRAREAQEEAERTVRQAREAAARVKLDEQIREIGAMDPSVKSLEDLAKMPTYPRFYELVQRGNTLTDAFRLANFDALAQSAAAGARQAAVNAVRSKEHLEQTKSRGKGALSVPAEVREQYKLFNPDATDEEIQRHYQKSHKEG